MDEESFNHLAQIDFERDVPVARIRGEVDLSNAEIVETEVWSRAFQDGPGLILDLTDLEHLDSAGVRLLFRLADRLATQGRQLRVVVPSSSPIRKVLQISGFDRAVSPDDTAKDAVRALGIV